MLIGYARVSTEDQHLDLQRDALARAGCGRTSENRRSGPERRAHAVELYRGRDKTVREICGLMGISKPTLYAYVAEAEGRP